MAEVVLNGVNKSFGKIDVIRNVNLHIDNGEFVVFVGPSGCGKSTLLRLISGLETLSSGDIQIADKTVTDLPPSKRGIAMVFQSYALYPHMTVFHNMAFDVFLFDEPLSNLDAALRHDTRVEIAKLHRQLDATTIYVTHDQVEAMTLADKIVVLKDGEVMQVGAPMDLFEKPANEFVAGFLGSPKMNFFEGVLSNATGEQGHFVGEGLDIGSIRLVSTSKSDGSNVKLGIRPQHMILDDNGPLKGTVTLVEQLGTESVLELISDQGTPFRFASPEKVNVAVGDQTRFKLDSTSAHLF